MVDVRAPMIGLKVARGAGNIPGSATAAGQSAYDLSEFRILYPNFMSHYRCGPDDMSRSCLFVLVTSPVQRWLQVNTRMI